MNIDQMNHPGIEIGSQPIISSMAQTKVIVTGNRYFALQANLQAIRELGQAISTASHFGCRGKGTGFVIAVDLFLTGQTCEEWLRDHQFMGNGAIYTPYQSIIAKFKQAGGKMRKIVKNPDVVSFELEWEGEVTNWSMTWELAKRGCFPYCPKKHKDQEKLIASIESEKFEGLKLKPKYATPRSRAIMMYARLADDAISTVAPEVRYGCAGEFVDDLEGIEFDTELNEEQSVPEVIPDQQVIEQEVMPQDAAGSVDQAAMMASVAEAVETQEGQPGGGDESGYSSSPGSPPVEQIVPDQQIVQDQGIFDQQIPSQQSYQSTQLDQSVDQGSSHQQMMESPNGAVDSIDINSPLTEQQYTTIRAKVLELRQVGYDAQPFIINKLKESGFETIRELTVGEGDQLYQDLCVKEVESWAETALIVGHRSIAEQPGN